MSELWWDLSDNIDHQRPLRAQQERTIACLVRQRLQWIDSIHRWAHGAARRAHAGAWRQTICCALLLAIPCFVQRVAYP